MLSDLKSNLRDTLAATGALPTSGGTTVAAEQVIPLLVDPVTGAVTGDGWTTDTLRALYAVAQRARVSAVYTAAIQNDIQIGRLRPGRTLSMSTMQTALWYPQSGRYNAAGDIVLGYGSPSDIVIGPGAVLPAFGSVPEVPSNRVLVSGVICTPDTQLTGAQAPLHAPTRFEVSDVLIILTLLGIAVGAAVLTTGAPTRAEQREARRNPFSELTPAQRRYAISQQTKKQLIAILKSRDPRGLYTDEERAQAGLYPLTHLSASKLVHQQMVS